MSSDDELQKKLDKYGISRYFTTSDNEYVHGHLEYTIEEFKELIDKFLQRNNAKNGTITFSVEHDTGYGGGVCYGVESVIRFSAFVPKTREKLEMEIARAEVEEQKKLAQQVKRKAAAALRLKKVQEKKLSDQQKKEQEERELYEKLKKKFETIT